MTEPCRLLDTRVPGVKDGAGGTVPGEPIERVLRHPYCRVSAVGAEGREQVVADQLQGLDLLQVRLAWDTPVERTDLLEVRGEELEIVQVDPLPTNAADRTVYVRST